MHNDFANNGVRLGLSAVLWLGLVLPGPGALAADDAAGDAEAKAFVDSLYSKRIDAVQKTRDADDDVALMTEMLDIAPTLPKQPDARSELYARIAEMSKKARAGFDIAFKALDALAKHNPKHPAAGRAARLEVYEAWYRGVDRDQRDEVGGKYFDALVAAADQALAQGDAASAKRWYNEAGSVQRVTRLERDFDLRDKLLEARGVERMQQEVEQLKAGVRDGLEPAKARRLVVLLALEMGQYEQASAYATLVKDEAFAKGLQAATAIGGTDLASQEDGEHPPSYWDLAGHWYAELADEPGLTDRAAERALLFARIALHRYIDATTQENLAKAQAAILVRQLDERYAKAYGPKEADPRDILALLDPAKHMISGKPFTVEDKKIILPPMSIMYVPVAGGDHYALTVKAQGGGSNEVAMWVWLPIGDRNTLLWLDGGENHYSRIEGLQGFENSPKTMRFMPGKPVEVRIEVKLQAEDQVAIRISFDGEETWKWRGSVMKLGGPTFGELPNTKHFALRGGEGLMIEKIQIQRYEDK